MSESRISREDQRVLGEYIGDRPLLSEEFAVLYYENGEVTVGGPYLKMAAEAVARKCNGLLFKRKAQTSFGAWEPVDKERG